MNNIIKRVWNQNRLVNIEDLTGMAFQAEIGGHTFEISGIDDTGAAVELSGTVSGVFRRPDNADIALTGSASDGVVSVTLSEDCYAVPGRFGLTIFVTSNSQKVAVYACVGTVAVSSTGNVAGDTPANVEDLLDAIDAAIADLNSAIGQIPASYANVMAAIAPTYSSSALYSVGSYAWYNGSLYRCITAITTAEAWTAAHWTAAVLGDDIGDLKSALNPIVDYTPLTGAFDGMLFTESNTIGYAAYTAMGYVNVSGLSYVRVVKHPNTKTFTIAFTRDATRPDRGSNIYNKTDYTGYNDVIVEVPEGSTYICALIYNANIGADASVGKDASKEAFHVYDISALDKKARSELSEYITESEPLLSSIGDIQIKTHAIERTGWNYYNNKIEDYPNKYWDGSTIGSAIRTSTNDTYRAVLIPIENVIYTTSSAPRFVHYLDSNKLLLQVDTNPTTIIDNTSINAAFLALTLYMAATDFVLKKDGEKGYEEYTGHGAWVFDNLEQETTLHHYLPSEICCAVGRTIELYNNLVCLEADKYHVNWTCDVGTTFERKFSVTGAASNVGNHSLVMDLYDDNMNLVASYDTVLKIVNPSITTQMNGVPIGDSLTNQKEWIPEVQNLSDNKIKFIGTRGYNDAAYNQEGRSGASSSWYVGNNTYTFDNHYIGNPTVSGSANPFWDGTKFSLSHYNTTQSAYIGGTPDFIVILLGINGLSFDNTTNVANIKTMVDNIRSEYPSLPVFVCNTPYRSNQNGYYSIGSDGYHSVADFQFGSDTKIMDLQNKIENVFAGYSNVHVVPMSLCMDREYDYGNVPTPVNPRLTEITIDIPNESVHPQLPGYYQMADALWSSIAAHLMN